MNIIEYLKQSVAPYFGEYDESHKYISKKVSWKEVFLLFVVFSIVGTIIGEVINPNPSYPLFINDPLLVFSIILGITIMMPITVLFSVSIQHLFLKLMGGKAKFIETLKFSNSISFFPLIVFTVIGLIPYLLIDNEMISSIIGIFILIVALIFMIWTLIVSAKMFSKVHKISFKKAIIAMILPILILFFFLLIIGILLVIFLIN